MSLLDKVKTKQPIYQDAGTTSIIYGKHKVGKTTLAMDYPDPLLIDIEGGTAKFDETRQFHLEYEMLEANKSAYQILFELGTELQGTDKYKSVILDTGDALWDLLTLPPQYRNRQGSIKLQVYPELYNQYRTILRLFRSNRRHVVLTLHTKEVSNEDGQIMATNPKLPGSFGESLCGEADFICFMAATSQMVEQADGDTIEKVVRYAVCQPSQHGTYGEIRAGNRGTLPRYVANPTYELIKNFREVHPGLFDGKGDPKPEEPEPAKGKPVQEMITGLKTKEELVTSINECIDAGQVNSIIKILTIAHIPGGKDELEYYDEIVNHAEAKKAELQEAAAKPKVSTRKETTSSVEQHAPPPEE